MNDELGFDFEAVDIYSRKDALENGLQVCVSELFPKIKELFPTSLPVYFTANVWNICENHLAPETIAWDICEATVKNAQEDPEGSLIAFEISVLGSGGDFLTHTIWATVGANDLDDHSHAVTVMFPEDH